METTIIKVPLDPYYAYVKIVGSLQFNLTEAEIKVGAEMLRLYENYLSQSTSFIAWELLNTPKNNKQIKTLLDLKDASFNNIKLSLKKKNFITDEGFNKGLKMGHVTFIINDSFTNRDTTTKEISRDTQEDDSFDDEELI